MHYSDPRFLFRLLLATFQGKPMMQICKHIAIAGLYTGLIISTLVIAVLSIVGVP